MAEREAPHAVIASGELDVVSESSSASLGHQPLSLAALLAEHSESYGELV